MANEIVYLDRRFPVGELVPLEYRDGFVIGVFAFSVDLFPLAKTFHESQISMFRHMETQTRIKSAEQKAKNPLEREKREEELFRRCQRDLKKYDDFRTAGLSPREAAKAAKKYHADRGHPLTCQQIEIMVAERKRLAKKMGRKI